MLSGEVKVILNNNSDNPLEIRPGVRVAQVICEKYVAASLNEVSDETIAGRLTSRNTGGFGSTDAEHEHMTKLIK